MKIPTHQLNSCCCYCFTAVIAAVIVFVVAVVDVVVVFTVVSFVVRIVVVDAVVAVDAVVVDAVAVVVDDGGVVVDNVQFRQGLEQCDWSVREMSFFIPLSQDQPYRQNLSQG